MYRDHRQTVQYIQPQHADRLAQAELLVIDEAAAIPLPVVRRLMGPYLVFFASTVNGYEGTGRSLSLKLISQLRDQAGAAPAAAPGPGAPAAAPAAARTFREVKLSHPIRYAPGDRVEHWLHDLLCLDAADRVPALPARLPHPDECDLYLVERDTLFSYHRASEALLQRMMSLYVASHYKNTPNDLLLMADAPAHRLFALLGPVDEGANELPDVLCVVQVALEGAVSRDAARASLAAGKLPQGDLIPWTVGQQFQDDEFPGLSGARVVRIAVHPELARGGYGSRAVRLLADFYEGKLLGVDEDGGGGHVDGRASSGAQAGSSSKKAKGETLQTEKLAPRQGLPPLLVSLSDRAPERLHYLGTSFGLTPELYAFWRKSGFAPVYLRQTASDITGENTVLMLRPLETDEVEGTRWTEPFVADFRARLSSLLAGPFREMPASTALTLLDPKISFAEDETQRSLKEAAEGRAPRVMRSDGHPLDAYDLRRLQAYSNSLVDYHLIMDLVPALARAYFTGQIPTTLSYGQAAILLQLGVQMVDVDEVEKRLNLPSNQVLALFNKAVRKLHGHLRASKEAAVARTLPQRAAAPRLEAVEEDLDEELEGHAAELREEMRAKLDPKLLSHFAIGGTDDDLAAAVGGAQLASGKVVSVKGDGKKKEAPAAALYKKDKKGGDKKRKSDSFKRGGDFKGKGTPGKKHRG